MSRLTLLLLALSPVAAHAYIGPGVGMGAVGVVIGLIASVLLAIVGLFWFPIKRILRKRKKNQAGNSGDQS